jgi:hypothetical protein
MKKRIIFAVILLLVFIAGAVVYTNINHKRIDEIGGFKITEITRISFQYNNPAVKGGTVENKEKIKEFMDYLSSCVFSKKLIQEPITGYYQTAVFFIDDKEVLRIMTYENFIDINGTGYNMVKNKLSLKKIDDFINSIKASVDTVTIITDRNIYTPAMSSARGITLTPDFNTENKHSNLIYHWITDEGEFIDKGKEVKNQGESVLWSAIANDKVIDIKNPFDIRLEVIDSGNQRILASAKLTITSDKGFYKVEKQ